jgi:hypothetical protein
VAPVGATGGSRALRSIFCDLSKDDYLHSALAYRQALRHCGASFCSSFEREGMAVTVTLRQAAMRQADPAKPPKDVSGMCSLPGSIASGGKENRDYKWMGKARLGIRFTLAFGWFWGNWGMADLLAQSCPAMRCAPRCPSVPLHALQIAALLIAQLMAGWRGSKTHRLSGAPASHLPRAVTPCARRSRTLPR